MSKNNILFLGYFFTPKDAELYSPISIADNSAQIGYISALEKIPHSDVFALSTVSPSHKSGYIKEKSFDIGDKSKGKYISYTNIKPLRPLSKFFSLFRDIKAWCQNCKNGNNYIFFYNTFNLYFLTTFLISLFYTVNIIPIFITHPYYKENKISIINSKVMSFFLTKIDGLIQITPFITQTYNIDVPSIVINGGIDESEITTIKDLNFNTNPTVLTYAGTLYDRYHIKEIIEAVKEFSSDQCILNIYGRGDLEEYVREQAKITPNIKFHGFVSQSDLKEAYRSSDVLFMLLDTNDNLAKFTYPSKIFEYLLSGCYVFCSNLPTIDDNLKSYLEVIDPINKENIALKIKTFSPENSQKRIEEICKCLKDNYTWSAHSKKIQLLLEKIPQ